MTTTRGAWSAVTASVRGASHERTGKPNQDATRLVEVDGPVPGLAAAVCDGHGGDRYVRSDVGARLAVEVACALGRDAMALLGPQPSVADIEAHLATALSPAVVAEWRARVDRHAADHPWTAEERSVVGSDLDGDRYTSYGCTLVLGLLADQWVGFLQIGDGDVTVASGDRILAPVPGDDRLVGGETTSLCLPDAARDARVAAFVGDVPHLVILTSDGYSNSFASSDWRTDIAGDLQRHLRDDGLGAVERRLPSWLAESAVAGGDDVSMVLVERSGTVPVGGAQRPSPVVADDEGTDGRPSNVWRLLVPLLAGLLIGAVVGRVLWGSSSSSSEESAEAEVVSTTAVPPVTTSETTEVGPGEATPTTTPTHAADDELRILHGLESTVWIAATFDDPGTTPSSIKVLATSELEEPLVEAQQVEGSSWTLDTDGTLTSGAAVQIPGVVAAWWDQETGIVWALTGEGDGAAVRLVGDDGRQECLPAVEGGLGCEVSSDVDAGSGVSGGTVPVVDGGG